MPAPLPPSVPLPAAPAFVPPEPPKLKKKDRLEVASQHASIARRLSRSLRAQVSKLSSSDLAFQQAITNVSLQAARCAALCSVDGARRAHSSPCLCRSLFYDWACTIDTSKKMKWETNCEYKVSKLCQLEVLTGIKGWGCVKLLNARLTKPSETAILAVPPATATLRTSPAGDRTLIVTMHKAIISQVCRCHAAK